MRKIKFRGKNHKGEWLYGDLLHINKSAFIAPIDGDWFDFIPRTKNNVFKLPAQKYEVTLDTIGQFTGLHDANGKEIYEGDIISQDGNIIGVICFSSRYGVSVKKNSTTWSLVNFCIDSDFDSGILSDIEVIGNIHDNKNLIK